MPRKSKAALAAEAAALEAAPAPARRGRASCAPKAAPKPPAEDAGDVPIINAPDDAAELDHVMTSEPADAGEAPTERAAAEASPAEPATAPSKPAARWDPAADTVQFDWPEIEQTASRPGPNQVMAKLLVAARAEGANSRWPFGAS